jgi:hypothetical protein
LEDQSEKKMGPFAIIGLILSITSIFVNGFLAIALAFLAVFAGFYALKKRNERFSTPGMYIGGIVLIIINLYNIGIIPSKIKQDITYLVHSVEGSIEVFNTLKEHGSTNREQLIQNIQNALRDAGHVNIERIDKDLPGFADHYRDEFIAGLKSLAAGYESDNMGATLKGGMLLDKWSAWYNQQHDELKRIRNTIPSPFDILRSILAG